jgi:8-oxo-dGTP diphosphatase
MASRGDTPDSPSVLDYGFQAAYVVAHRMLRAYWYLRRPSTHGSLVALWNEGEVLLVKNSYRFHYTLPGGYIHPGETPLDAARRELIEEVGVAVPEGALHQAYTATHDFEFRRDRVTISEIELDHRPKIQVDHREVVWAGFLSPAQVLERPVVPHLVEYLRLRGDA